MLDPQGRNEVLEVVRKLNREQGVTVIAVTHYMDEIVGADKVIVMEDGQIALTGTPSQIFSQKEKLKALGLELPVSAEIAQKLIDRGVNLPDGILTRQKLMEELCALKSKI